MNLTTEYWLFFLASGSFAVVGNLLLKAGVNKLSLMGLSLRLWQELIFKVFTTPEVFIGFILYGLSSFLYLKLLSLGYISKTYPMSVAYMSLVILLLSSVFLKESLTIPKIIGSLIILVGIFVVSR